MRVFNMRGTGVNGIKLVLINSKAKSGSRSGYHITSSSGISFYSSFFLQFMGKTVYPHMYIYITRKYSF